MLHRCARCGTLVLPFPGCPMCGATTGVGRPVSLVFGAVVLGLGGCALGAGSFQPAYGIAETGRETGNVEDADGDGYTTGGGSGGGDCDDTNPDIHPGAVETMGDEVDSNCDQDDDT